MSWGLFSGVHLRRIFCHVVVEYANVIACEQSYSYGLVQLSYLLLVHLNFVTKKVPDHRLIVTNNLCDNGSLTPHFSLFPDRSLLQMGKI